MVLQQQILLRVTTASLQVGTATGQIDAEIADTRELQNYLSGRRDSKLAQLDLLNLAIGGTFGTANSALGFTNHDLASALTSAVAGSAAVVLSVEVAACAARRGQAITSAEQHVERGLLSSHFAKRHVSARRIYVYACRASRR